MRCPLDKIKCSLCGNKTLRWKEVIECPIIERKTRHLREIIEEMIKKYKIKGNI